MVRDRLRETKQFQQDLGVDRGCAAGQPSSGILFLGKLQILLQEILGSAAARSSLGSLGGRRDPVRSAIGRPVLRWEWGKVGKFKVCFFLPLREFHSPDWPELC